MKRVERFGGCWSSRWRIGDRRRREDWISLIWEHTRPQCDCTIVDVSSPTAPSIQGRRDRYIALILVTPMWDWASLLVSVPRPGSMGFQ
jgi:hypothetical protein